MIEAILHQSRIPVQPELELPAAAPIIVARPAPPSVVTFTTRMIHAAILLTATAGICFLAYTFVTIPYRVPFDQSLPIKTDPIIISEKISYLIRKPFMGEVIMFRPTDEASPMVGIVSGIDLQTNQYNILTSGSRNVAVAPDHILARVYFPQSSFNQEETRASTSIPSVPYSLPPSATLSGIVSTPLPMPKFTPTATPAPLRLPGRQTTVPRPTQPPYSPPPVPTSPPPPPPVPGRSANPPIVSITYPAEMATLNQATARVCLVETPTGGDTSGLKHRYSIYNQAWTDYADMSTLCFNAAEGTNAVRLQYRNSYGEESGVYQRQFTLVLPEPTAAPQPTATAVPTAVPTAAPTPTTVPTGPLDTIGGAPMGVQAADPPSTGSGHGH
jgi:hypothetical protein